MSLGNTKGPLPPTVVLVVLSLSYTLLEPRGKRRHQRGLITWNRTPPTWGPLPREPRFGQKGRVTK